MKANGWGFAAPFLVALAVPLRAAHDHAHMDPACGMGANAAFCDTFDTAFPGGRGGDLDERSWNFSRHSQAHNPSQGFLNAIPQTDAFFCTQIVRGIYPPSDSFFCGAQFNESNHWMTAMNDAGYFNISGMIRRPLDIVSPANRKNPGFATFTMDVDAKSKGHGWWIEVWFTDLPSPVPHAIAPAITNIPRNGLGISFENDYCGGRSGTLGTGGGVGSIRVFKDYRDAGFEGRGFGDDSACFTAGHDEFNRIEIRLNQNKVEVWATDKSPDHVNFPPLRKIAELDNLGLPFSKAYVHVEHVQYNPSKFGAPQLCSPLNPSLCLPTGDMSTYHWDNMGFDGPRLPMPRAYDVPDTLIRFTHPEGNFMNTAYLVNIQGMSDGDNPIAPLAFNGVDLTGATGAMITMEDFRSDYNWSVKTLRYRFNGGTWRPVPAPVLVREYPDSDELLDSTLAFPVPLSDLRQGNNTLEFGVTDDREEHALLNISLLVDTDGSGLPPPPAGKLGDLNGDNAIDVTDLGMLLGKWNTNDPVADIDHSGTVEIGDLSSMLREWGK